MLIIPPYPIRVRFRSLGKCTPQASMRCTDLLLRCSPGSMVYAWIARTTYVTGGTSLFTCIRQRALLSSEVRENVPRVCGSQDAHTLIVNTFRRRILTLTPTEQARQLPTRRRIASLPGRFLPVRMTDLAGVAGRPSMLNLWRYTCLQPARLQIFANTPKQVPGTRREPLANSDTTD
jgi:hypothetical protein